MPKKKRVTIFTGPEGHKSISDSVFEKLKNTFDVSIIDLTGKEFSFYKPFYLFFPQLFQIPYTMGKQKQMLSVIKKYARKKYTKKLHTTLIRQNPDIIVSTWPFYNPALESLSHSSSQLFINIVADPRTIHPAYASKLAINCVFDLRAKESLIKMGVEADKILVTGWFTQHKFTPVRDKNLSCKTLDLDSQLLTFLVVGGSEGTTAILKILPSFLYSSRPIQVIVVCGANKKLYQLVQQMAKVNSLNPKSKAKIYALPFSDKLHQYIQVSDLVIGKAGPNLLFESVACHVPFLAITHISGQENGNLEIIRQNNLGIVEENAIKILPLIRSIIQNPQRLKNFHGSLVKMAQSNQKSGHVLETAIVELTKI